jgi:ABC-type Fe3+-hydroxamate transport system substrate-binding protein
VIYVGGWSELDIEMIVNLAPDIIVSDRSMLPEGYEKARQIAPVVTTGEMVVARPEALQQWEYELPVWDMDSARTRNLGG